MSEYVSEIADRYAELMAPAFVEGLQGHVTVDEIPEDRALSVHLLQPIIRTLLSEADWEHSGLPVKKFNNEVNVFGPADMTPEAYASKLMAFAFDDAYQLLKLCESFAGDKGLPEEADLGEVLKNSKRTLLRVSQLPDPSKGRLYYAIKYPDIAADFGEFTVFPAGEDIIHLEEDKDGRLRFNWHPEIQEFFDDEIDSSRGCPANKKIITNTDGQKQTLTFFFWDRLVEIVYNDKQ